MSRGKGRAGLVQPQGGQKEQVPAVEKEGKRVVEGAVCEWEDRMRPPQSWALGAGPGAGLERAIHHTSL